MEISKLKISIVGLGLMGGSLAMALRNDVDWLTGVDHDLETRDLAKHRGVIDTVIDNLGDGVAAADLIILAVPVQSILKIIRTLPEIRPDGCMLLDLGSTKAEIGQAMAQLPSQFSAIGGHPMCGRERSGFEAAAESLYRDQTFILCRNARTTETIEEIAVTIVRKLKGRPLFMSPEIHDRLVATSSHLPYVVATTLMRRAWSVANEDERLWQVSASGLQDTTRLAGSNPQMMLEILVTNRALILEQIDSYRSEISRLADKLRDGRDTELFEILDQAQRQRAEYLSQKFEQNRKDREQA